MGCRAGYAICTGYSDYNETQAELKRQRELAEYQRQQRLEALANKTAKELALKEKMEQERKEAEEKRLREAAAKKRKEDGTKLEEERLKQVDEFERDKRWAEQRREAIANATTKHSAIVSKEAKERKEKSMKLSQRELEEQKDDHIDAKHRKHNIDWRARHARARYIAGKWNHNIRKAARNYKHWQTMEQWMERHLAKRD